MAIRGRRPFNRKPRGPEHRINQYIRAEEVRISGEGIESKVCSTKEAIAIAQEAGLDLVEIAPNAKPPVCRVVDYAKFLYNKKKKEKEIKAKAQKTVVKEIRFTPNTDTHDFEFKAKHAEGFINDGAKIKVFVQFKGRSIVFKDKGFEILEKFVERLEEIARVEQEPKMEGRRITMVLSPNKLPKKKN